MYNLKNIENLKIDTRRTVGIYSLVFVVVSIGIFAMFILLDRTFVQFGDAYRQGYFWIAEIKHNLESFFGGDGYPAWSWSRGTGLEVGYLTDPFNLIAALFPWAHLELGYTLALVARMYLAGLAFIAFGREVRMSHFSCLMGGIFYAFSTWTVNIALMQARFVMIIVLLPILILSIDRIYKGKSPLLFMVTVGYYIIENSYLAFMAGLMAVVYIFLRYFAYSEGSFRIRDYAAKIGMFMVYGLTGVLMSSIMLIQRFVRVGAASTESSGQGIDLLYGESFYLDLGKHIISEGLTDGYSYVGIPILAIMLLAVAFRRISVKNTSVLMTLIMFGMMLFPFFSSMFNGFSYNSGRWYYMIPFFAIWAAVENLNRLKERGNRTAMAIGLGIIAIATLGFAAAGLVDLDINGAAFIAVNVAGGLVLLLILCKSTGTPRMRQLLTVGVTCITLVVAWNGSLYGNMGKFVHDGDMYKQLTKSTQRVSASIDDDDFCRTDQVYWINVDKEMKMPANENLWWQSKSIYMYDSKLPAALLDFNRLVGNSYGYSKRVYMLSNDNRAGLDYLYGVRYFLGDDTTNGRTGADEYADYGFEHEETIDGVHVFRNKYDAGLGFAYDKCISRSEFEKLTPLQREQALLQAVVIPDEFMKDVDIESVTDDDIETDVTDVKYEVTGTDGVAIDGGRITASKEDASFTISVKDAPAGQLMISFDNLIRGGGETSQSFKLKCENERLSESADNEQTNQSIYNVRDYNLNMGYYDGYSGEIRVTLSEAGEYSFDDIRISSMNMDIYDKYAGERSQELYRVEEYDDSSVKGTVDLQEKGIVFFSIASCGNWDVYVDGSKADKIVGTNVAFMGVEADRGHHEIELRYNNSLAVKGMITSLAGLVIGLAIALIHRRKKA